MGIPEVILEESISSVVEDDLDTACPPHILDKSQLRSVERIEEEKEEEDNMEKD